jgi:hypothetical protein
MVFQSAKVLLFVETHHNWREVEVHVKDREADLMPVPINPAIKKTVIKTVKTTV